MIGQFLAKLHSIERAKNNKSEYDRIKIYRYITTIQVVVVVVVVVIVIIIIIIRIYLLSKTKNY